VQSAPPLEQVTTKSLDALKRYVQGSRVLDEGDFPRAMALLQEAVALDTGFAMAYRKLGVEYGNRGLREKAGEYYEKAYVHIDRLSDPERYLLLGSYYQLGRRQDAAKSTAAYERLLEIQPNNTAGLNNLATQMLFTHQYARAETLLARAIRVGPPATSFYRNLARAQTALGRLDSTRATADACAKALPTNVECRLIRATELWSLGRYDSVEAMVPELDRRMKAPAERALLLRARSDLARVRGKLRDANRFIDEAAQQMQEAGNDGASLTRDAVLALDRAWFLGDTSGAQRMLDEALTRTPLRAIGSSDAPYQLVVAAYGMAGRPDRARGVMTEWGARRRLSPTVRDSILQHTMAGRIALAEKDYPRAQRELRAAGEQACPICELPLVGRAYDLAGMSDSAVVVYERFLNERWLDRTEVDARYLPAVHKRLGELYEARGQRDKALQHYRTFIELWKDADPELQPRVTDAKQRVAALTRGTDR
jgi:tetratricopeptide (TPR) repeat protein